MKDEARIGANLARLRRDRDLTQEELAKKAGLSRVTVGKAERGTALPRAGTLRALAGALGVRVADLVAVVRPLDNVRFRARATVYSREQILAEVSERLAGYYEELEACLAQHLPFRFGASWDPAWFGSDHGPDRGGGREVPAEADSCLDPPEDIPANRFHCTVN